MLVDLTSKQFLANVKVERAQIDRIGALFRIIGVASPVRVRRDAAICDSCGACDLACSLDQSPMTDRLDSGCERCAKCVAACPCSALRMTAGSPLPSLTARRQAP